MGIHAASAEGYSAITFGSALNTNMTADETARRVPTPITDAAPKAYKYRNLSTGLIYEDPFGRDEWETLVFVELATCQQLEQENATLRELAEGLKADKERLDWLEANNIRILKSAEFLPYSIEISASGELIRSAIDAARYRAACPGEGKESSL
jgi:hypothetical protein